MNEVAIEHLQSGPQTFLTCLAWHLAIAARGAYAIGQGEGMKRGDFASRATNELLVMVTEQLRSLTLGHSRCPDDEFLGALRQTAAIEGSTSLLEFALQRATGECDSL